MYPVSLIKARRTSPCFASGMFSFVSHASRKVVNAPIASEARFVMELRNPSSCSASKTLAMLLGAQFRRAFNDGGANAARGGY